MGMGRNLSALLAILLTTAAVAQERPQDREPITNYWRHILQIISEQELRQEHLRGTENLVNPPPKEYPFEAFAHLSSRDLMRAVQEGIEAAKRENFRKPEAVVNQAIQQNILIALEYYPLVARDPSDFNSLLYAIDNSIENKQLRLFLLNRLTPGTAPRSLFSIYMQEQVAEDAGEVRKALGRISQRPSEDGQVFGAAVEALYALYKRELEDNLRQIEPVAALAANQPLTEVLLADGAMAGLPQEARIKVAQLGVVFNDLVKRMEAIIDPFAGFPPDNRLAARRVLDRIYNEIPLENRAQIKSTLDKYPVEDLKKPLDRLAPPEPAAPATAPQQALKPYDPNDPSTWPIIEGEANAAMFAPPPGTTLPPTR